ncbi:AAA family ATPase [Phycicoccus sonneratiae]|uniref:AAA family ATPase n=1 Tax=Phycicoccus sonneratiae TaxID=2807628 RepID=A0ABS2CI77_9MICO|nr:AAA family ATPase [Phycicoccus sonneraticus]MBM6399576.1 AAA family ATPase [Phycicoccus sonneraticus]
MRIVVSGTHATGKSTLVADLGTALGDHEILGDPWELVDDDLPLGSAASFAAQLEAAAERLLGLAPGADVVVERGPLDLMAYLLALGELGRPAPSPAALEPLRALTARATARVDLLVVLPLAGVHGLYVPEEEDLDLRAAADGCLLDLLDDDEVLPPSVAVLEVAGPPEARVAAVLAALGRG